MTRQEIAKMNPCKGLGKNAFKDPKISAIKKCLDEINEIKSKKDSVFEKSLQYRKEMQ